MHCLPRVLCLSCRIPSTTLRVWLAVAQEREDAARAREDSLERAKQEQVAAARSAQAELARLQEACHDLGIKLRDAEADYMTGSERLQELRREVRLRGTQWCYLDVLLHLTHHPLPCHWQIQVDWHTPGIPLNSIEIK